jgi:hypothetical protein
MEIKLLNKEYDTTWELYLQTSIETKKVSIEFDVKENVISEGWVQYYPVDQAHFEPAEVEYEFTINTANGVHIADEHDDWDSYELTQEEHDKILKYIEENYDYGL